MYGRKEKKITKDVAVKKQYQSYYQMMTKAGKQPMTQYHWRKSGRAPSYFKGTETTRPEAKLYRKARKKLGLKD